MFFCLQNGIMKRMESKSLKILLLKVVLVFGGDVKNAGMNGKLRFLIVLMVEDAHVVQIELRKK